MLLETCIINYCSLPETTLIKELTGNQNNENNNNNQNKRDKSHVMNNNVEIKLENFIKRNFDAVYRISIKKVNKLNENVIIVEPRVNFCMNVNREHSSSGTYFQIKKSGICQKCFCNKVSETTGICCRNYSSKEIPLSNPLKKILFTETVNKRETNINFKINNNKVNIIKNCKGILQELESKINQRNHS